MRSQRHPALGARAASGEVHAIDPFGHAVVRPLKPTPSTLFVGIGPSGLGYARASSGNGAGGGPSPAKWEQVAPEAISQELARRAKRVDWFPVYLVTGLLAGPVLFLVVLGSLAAHPILGAFVLFISVGVTVCAVYGGYKLFVWNQERRHLSIVYDVAVPALYQRAAAATRIGETLVSSQVTSITVFPDLARAPTRFRVNAWPALLTNVQLWSGRSTGRSFLFLPDQLLLKLGERVLGFPYSRLSVTSSWIDSAEMYGTPKDAEVVGRTWLHARKGGGT